MERDELRPELWSQVTDFIDFFGEFLDAQQARSASVASDHSAMPNAPEVDANIRRWIEQTAYAQNDEVTMNNGPVSQEPAETEIDPQSDGSVTPTGTEFEMPPLSPEEEQQLARALSLAPENFVLPRSSTAIRVSDEVDSGNNSNNNNHDDDDYDEDGMLTMAALSRILDEAEAQGAAGAHTSPESNNQLPGPPPSRAASPSTASSATISAGTPRLARSCTFCHAQKKGCDRMWPCGRCAKAGRSAEQCVAHPAPQRAAKGKRKSATPKKGTSSSAGVKKSKPAARAAARKSS